MTPNGSLKTGKREEPRFNRTSDQQDISHDSFLEKIMSSEPKETKKAPSEKKRTPMPTSSLLSSPVASNKRKLDSISKDQVKIEVL